MKFGVIGLGRFGYQLAVGLADQGMEVLAIDADENIIESIKDKVTQAICMRIANEESLLNLGIEDMNTVIVATGEDFEQSVLITALLKNRLHIPHVIARANDTVHEEILNLIGADSVVLPEQDTGVRLADKLSMPLVNLVTVEDTFAVTQLRAPSSFVGKAIGDLKPVINRKVACCAVKKGENLVIISEDYVVLENDVLVFAGDRKHLAQLVHA